MCVVCVATTLCVIHMLTPVYKHDADPIFTPLTCKSAVSMMGSGKCRNRIGYTTDRLEAAVLQYHVPSGLEYRGRRASPWSPANHRVNSVLCCNCDVLFFVQMLYKCLQRIVHNHTAKNTP